MGGSPSWLRDHPIAHRGLHGPDAPENGLSAFLAAAEAGYGIELDVHLSADGRLVVMHDADLRRTTGHPGLVGELAADRIRELTLLGSDEPVPLLEDVLGAVAGRVPLLVEVKAGNGPMPRLGAALISTLAASRGPYAVQSFDPRVVIWLRRNAPEVLRGQLAGDFDGAGLSFGRRLSGRAMALNAVARPHFIAYDIDALPNLAATAWRRVLRVPLLAWTVRTPAQWERARRLRANVIFEDMAPPLP